MTSGQKTRPQAQRRALRLAALGMIEIGDRMVGIRVWMSVLWVVLWLLDPRPPSHYVYAALVLPFFMLFSSRLSTTALWSSFGALELGSGFPWDDVVIVRTRWRLGLRLWDAVGSDRSRRERSALTASHELPGFSKITRRGHVAVMRELVKGGYVPAEKVVVPERWRGSYVDELRALLPDDDPGVQAVAERA